MGMKLANNSVSTLAAALTAGSTTVTIQPSDAGAFPVLGKDDWHPLTVVDAAGNSEIMRVTARAGAVLTVVRAQEGTTAKAFGIGSRADLRLTVGAVMAIIEAQVQSDWNATSGKAVIQNKPTLGTAAAKNVEDFLTSKQAEGKLDTRNPSYEGALSGTGPVRATGSLEIFGDSNTALRFYNVAKDLKGLIYYDAEWQRLWLRVYDGTSWKAVRLEKDGKFYTDGDIIAAGGIQASYLKIKGANQPANPDDATHKAFVEWRAGQGRRWYDMTGQRAKDTSYVNNTGRDIEVILRQKKSATRYLAAWVSGQMIVDMYDWTDHERQNQVTFTVPNGADYRMSWEGTWGQVILECR